MNLVAYDKVQNLIHKTGTWIDVNRKRLLSREIVKRSYITFGKRYDASLKQTVFYIILLDTAPVDRPYTKLKIDDYGRIKIDIKSIYTDAGFDVYQKDSNITLKHIEHTDDADVYELVL